MAQLWPIPGSEFILGKCKSGDFAKLVDSPVLADHSVVFELQEIWWHPKVWHGRCGACDQMQFREWDRPALKLRGLCVWGASLLRRSGRNGRGS